jgi:hypothetical protein
MASPQFHRFDLVHILYQVQWLRIVNNHNILPREALEVFDEAFVQKTSAIVVKVIVSLNQSGGIIVLPALKSIVESLGGIEKSFVRLDFVPFGGDAELVSQGHLLGQDLRDTAAGEGGVHMNDPPAREPFTVALQLSYSFPSDEISVLPEQTTPFPVQAEPVIVESSVLGLHRLLSYPTEYKAKHMPI